MGFCLSRGGNSGTQGSHIAVNTALCKYQAEANVTGLCESSLAVPENSAGLQIPLMVARNFINPPAQCRGSAMVNTDPLRLSYLSSTPQI